MSGHPLHQVSHCFFDFLICCLQSLLPHNKHKLASACSGGPHETECLSDSTADLVPLGRFSQSSRYAHTHLYSIVGQVVQNEIPVRCRAPFFEYSTIMGSRYPSFSHGVAPLRLCRQPFPALRSSAGDNLAPTTSLHPRQKSMRTCSLTPLGLVCALHGRHPPRIQAGSTMVREIISRQKFKCQLTGPPGLVPTCLLSRGKGSKPGVSRTPVQLSLRSCLDIVFKQGIQRPNRPGTAISPGVYPQLLISL